MPLPKTKIFLSQALADGQANLLLEQGAGDFVVPVKGSFPSPWLAGLPDLNGDVVPEFIVGAPGNDGPSADAGRVFVTLGTAVGGGVSTLGNPAASFVINGAATGDLAGTSVAGIADLNVDGRGDLLIGAPGADNGAVLDTGAGYVVWGQAGAGAQGLSALGAAGSGKGYILKGQVSGDLAGQAMASIADQNGDGKADVLISAPGYDTPAKSGGGGGGGGGSKLDVGAVYVVWGKSTDTPVNLADVGAGTGGYRIVGDGTHDAVGTTLGTVADLNGDGRAEILVGAPSSGIGGTDSGAVYVVFGKSTGTEVALKSLGAGGFRIVGALGDKAGGSIASVADLNGDGKPEILVGADNSDKLYVVFGKSGTTDVLLSDVSAGIGGFVIKAEAPGDFQGMSVTAGGDFNRDGRPDIVIGAPSNSEGGRDAGAVYVVWGGSTGIVDLALVAQGVGGAKIVGTAGSMTGSSVAMLGDTNHDGTPDLLIGSAGLGQGSVNVLFAPDTWQPDNNIYGTNGDDTIGAGYGSGTHVVGEGHDNVLGLGGNDTISTGGGADDLDGGTGADTLAGGAGDDKYYVDNIGDTTLEDAAAGTDTVFASIDWTLAPNLEKLQLVDGATQGTGNAGDNTITAGAIAASLKGLDGNDKLVGSAGNDTLDGGAGADLLVGGQGDDRYVVDQLGDVVQEAAGGGTDTIVASIDLTLPANVEKLELSGSATSGTGNELNNTLVGTAANDVLDGGLGADLMAGGLGDDRYLVDNASDTVSEAPGAGVDTIVASVDFTLAANVEVLRLSGTARHATGNASDNTLVGTPGDDTLDGGAGADLMVGGAGNDTYLVDNASDVIQETAGGGNDTVIASIDTTLGAELESLQLTGAAHVGIGNAAANTLTGGPGNDTLDGAGGADLLIGGLGDDTYRIDPSDTVQEAVDGGNDTIIAGFDATLPANVETLQVTGEGTTATGNAGDNILLGSAGHQTLIGGGGNDSLDGGTGGDTMDGGAGDDTYYVDDLNDIVIEGVGGGNDTVVTAFNGTVADNIENVRLTGAAHTVTGNSGNNRLSGNSGDDVLDGAAGDDLLLGGDGSDTLHSHSGNDTLSGGSGDDVYKIGGGSSAHIEDFLGHDTIDASDATGDNSIDLSGDTGSRIDGEDVYFTPGGSSAAPLDVQFLQDLTGSFGDDIANVRLLVPQIVTALRAVQANSEFGVTSFVDKPFGSFGAPNEWVYKLELGLTANAALLSSTYNALGINSGLDEPEAQLESLMQLALHAGETGFRPDSARFVVLFTDAHYHVAGEGIAAGIPLPNNGDAVIAGGGAGEDYPFIPQVRTALEAANIIPVFAIANGLTGTYQTLADSLGRGVVVPLTVDSSNVVTAIISGLTAATTTYIEDAYGGSGNDTLTGNIKDNHLRGNDGNDRLSGGAGNDLLDGGHGNDDIDGGADTDTAIYTGALADYAIGSVDGAITIADQRAGSPDGTDLLRNVETLVFSDGALPAAQFIDTPPVAVDDVAAGVVEAGGVGNATAGQAAAAGNVLANDTDANLAFAAFGEQLHVAGAQVGVAGAGAVLAAVAGPTAIAGRMGTLTLQPDGSYSYSLDDSLPATQALKAGEAGTDVFSYAVSDKAGHLDTGLLTVQVTGANDAPTVSVTVLAPILADSGVQLITAAQLLVGASDVDGDALTVSALTADSGTLVDNGNGTWNFTSAMGDQTGVTFHYTVGDGLLGTAATATLDLLPDTAVAPTTTDATASGLEDAAAIAVPLSGLDANGSVVAFHITSLPTGAALFADAGLSTPLALNGSVAAAAGGATVYLVPAANVNGSLSFGFAAVDNDGLQDASPATATVTVAPVNDVPVALADILSATEDTVITFTAAQLLGNDSDADGDALAIASVASVDGGSVALNAAGTVTFTPAPNFNGAAHFSYTATDGQAASAGTGVTINVAAVNDAPFAVADTLAATEDTPVVYSAAQLLGNDSDADGDALAIASITGAVGGTAVLNADGSIGFAPFANFNGAAGFSYRATDGLVAGNSAAVAITVASVNDAPVASDDAGFIVNAGALLARMAVLANDTDVDGDTLQIAGTPTALHGAVTVNADGTLDYTSVAGYVGSDTITYLASDGTLTATGHASITVKVPNEAPVVSGAVALVASNEDAARTITPAELLATASDLNGDALSVQNLVASSGTLVALADGSWAFQPALNDDTAVSFAYRVFDGLESTAASATLDLLPVNDAAVISGVATGNVTESATTAGSPLATGVLSATDVDNPASFSVLAKGSYGTLAISAAGAWSYSLDNTNAVVDALDTGSAPLVDTVTVQTTDGTTRSIAITISGANDLRTGTTGGDTLTGGNGTDTLNGLAGRDTLTGLAGNDLLDGGADADTMAGGAGDDTYVVDNAKDSVTENAGEGYDTVQSSIGFVLPANVEALQLTGTAAIDGTGNALDNIVTGNSGANVLLGGAGADALDGGAGIDTASYAGSTAGVTVSLFTGLGAGGDAAGDTLANIENLTGSSANDTLEGSAGNNVLNGGAGTDTLSFEHAASAVTANLALTAAQNTGGAGTDTLSGFENLTGSAFDDNLTGSSADNLLSGGDGNDSLNGSAGADTLVGGAGADRFVFANLGDLASGAVHDTIRDFSHAEGDLINLVGLDADTKTGGDQAFTFIGSAAFGGHAGELRYVVTAGGLSLMGDTNGDGKVDFTIDLVGVTSLQAPDLLL